MAMARAFYSVVVASSVALGGCRSSMDARAGPPGDSALEWRVEDRAITAANLTAPWGFSASNVFAVGGTPGCNGDDPDLGNTQSPTITRGPDIVRLTPWRAPRKIVAA
jgi:hypothetical protein